MSHEESEWVKHRNSKSIPYRAKTSTEPQHQKKMKIVKEKKSQYENIYTLYTPTKHTMKENFIRFFFRGWKIEFKYTLTHTDNIHT